MSDLLDRSLVAIAAMIAKKTVSATEVTRHLLDRVAKVDPVLNAFVAIEPERALDQAKAADKKRARGEAGPLLGVPLAHKDLLSRLGEPASGGSALRKDWRGNVDATVLRRLDAAGAVTIGRLTMGEFAYDPTGDNQFAAPSRNPWNTDFICGGSSSGSGAAVAARLCYGSLGTDTGGSIRLPASVCGVVGLKPTHGRVSLHGCMPLSFSLDCIGPLARDVRDAARLLAIIAGWDKEDPATSRRSVDDYEAACEQSPRGLRIGVPRDYFWRHLNEEHAVALNAAMEGLAHSGCELKPVNPPDVDVAVAAANIILGSESAALHRPLFIAHSLEYNPAVRTRLENGVGYTAIEYIDALRYREQALSQFLAAIAGVDVLIAPTLGVTPPTIAQTKRRAATDVSRNTALLTYWTRPVNFLGVPAISTPFALDAAGIPIGIQFIGKPFEEATLIRAAALLEANATLASARPPETV